jgi:hypothetical protein
MSGLPGEYTSDEIDWPQVINYTDHAKMISKAFNIFDSIEPLTLIELEDWHEDKARGFLYYIGKCFSRRTTASFLSSDLSTIGRSALDMD